VGRDAHRRHTLIRRIEDTWDNDDVRVRPSRSTRPRTKTRPAHDEAVGALVITVDRGRYGCLIDAGGRRQRQVTAMRARELGRRGVVVGDRVELVGDTSGAPDTLARIVRIAARDSVLRRSRDDAVDAEGTAVTADKVLVANADQLAIVTALADPEPRPGFIDRCLVAAYTGNLDPFLVLTKADLADPANLLASYSALDLPVVVTSRDADRRPDPSGMAQLRELVDGKVTVLIGHSGVGKSTLVNLLVPDADRATGSVTGVGKGRHTSTSAVALQLPTGGWVVDTPGVRSLGLAHVTPDDLIETFGDLLPATVDCPPGCGHDENSPGCALDSWVAQGHASVARLASFRRLLASRAGAADDLH
jgi:ribosome biogenesis GTPase / thiamine phosphate phosphatase